VEPVDVLRAFWTAMCEWERRAFRFSQMTPLTRENVAPLANERAAIVAEYCTPKKRVNSEPFSCGDPPQYDPDNEDVLEVVAEGPRRVVVHTQQRAGFQDRRKYVVLRRENRWFIDSWQSLSNGKWARGIV
jgi:hypothetical protein